jgi:hypothetical protein
VEKETIGAVVSVLLAIMGVAVLAELVSNQAQTGNVLTAGGTGITKMLCTALSPLGIHCGESVTSNICYNPPC